MTARPAPGTPATCCAFAALLSFATPATGDEIDHFRVPFLYVMPSFALTDQTQTGFRQWLESEQHYLDGASPPVPHDDWRTRFDPSVTPGFEFGTRVTERWSFAISLTAMKAKVENTTISAVAAPFYNEWSTRIEDHLTELSAHAVYWPAQLPGGHVGVRLGSAREQHSVNGGGWLDGDANHQLRVGGLWRSTAATYGLYAGWQTPYAANPRVEFRAGWDWRDRFSTDAGGLLDYDGRVVPVDFSGAFASVGFVFAVGSRPAAP